MNRRAFITAIGSLPVAGCLSLGTSGTGGTGGPLPPTTQSTVPLDTSLEDYAENSVSGGVGKDGIPSIDDPSFLAPEDVDFLAPGDVVFGVEIDGETKAYPQKILAQHEIVNDTVGGEKVSVTYCPLTGTVIGYKRGDTTFGVSGNLVNNNLVMYDRSTDSRWPQILGTAMSGQLKGKSLEEFRVIWTTWSSWRDKYPDTQVLSQDTGHIRNYERDPYGSYNPKDGYYSSNSTLFGVMNSEDTYSKKEIVMGARTADGAVVFHKGSLREDKVISGDVAGTTYTAFYDEDLDTAYVYRGDGSDYDHDGGSYVADGERHEPSGIPLESVNTFDAMWFAWAAFYKNTEVYE